MSYQAPNIWYTQDNNLSKAIDSLNQIANQFFVGERQMKDERKYKVKMAQILQAQKQYNINPYEYGDPFENDDDFNRYMANVQDTANVINSAENYTPFGGTLSVQATKEVSAGIDPTPQVYDRNDIAITESWLLGGTDLANSSFWKGLVNQDVLLPDDADDLMEKGLLYAQEVDQWSNPQVRNQVKKRWGKWKETFISTNDIYKTDDEFESWVTNLNVQEGNNLDKVKSGIDYQLATADAKNYSQRFVSNFGKFDKDNKFEAWGRRKYWERRR